MIEMNPRVSRSSALASKATGFPIAKIAAKLAVGYSLDEIPNDITRATPASFEPALDYVVTKIPRFAFEKFPELTPRLTTRMHSVGEVMAIGRTFTESLMKAMASLEVDPQDVSGALDEPNPYRIFAVFDALRAGMDIAEIYARTQIDPFFIASIARIVAAEGAVFGDPGRGGADGAEEDWAHRRVSRRCCRHFDRGDAGRPAGRLAYTPTYKSVDTCAGEFPARTPYYYSTYEIEDEVERGDNPSVVVLGSGPNRIGQGIEFDYACVHASYALKESRVRRGDGQLEPRDRLHGLRHLHPAVLRAADRRVRLEVIRREKPEGVILQFGGQSPLKLARELEKNGVRILGTTPDAIDLAEDRSRFGDLLTELGIPHPRFGDRQEREGGPGDSAGARLPRGRAPLLRPRRTADGDRVQR